MGATCAQHGTPLCTAGEPSLHCMEATSGLRGTPLCTAWGKTTPALHRTTSALHGSHLCTAWDPPLQLAIVDGCGHSWAFLAAQLSCDLVVRMWFKHASTYVLVCPFASFLGLRYSIFSHEQPSIDSCCLGCCLGCWQGYVVGVSPQDRPQGLRQCVLLLAVCLGGGGLSCAGGSEGHILQSPRCWLHLQVHKSPRCPSQLSIALAAVLALARVQNSHATAKTHK